ncbi:MAG: bifunctional nuclease family protein [Candidatus Aenigmatarchaeota archaeon]
MKATFFKKLLAVLIAIFCIQIALNVWLISKLQPLYINIPTVKEGVKEGMIPSGYVQANVSIANDSMILISGCRALSIAISSDQANSIKTGLSGETGPRPLTHDMAIDIMRFFGIDVLAARVDRLEGQTYYGRLLLSSQNRQLSLDVRPSDAAAIAVRLGIPLWINESLLAYGEDICS